MPRTANPAPLRFTVETFTFLKDLAAHNDRPWLAANKQRYEAHVLAPAVAFVEAMGPRLRKISKHFVASPKRTGGSLLRIYRDTRFARDKSPIRREIVERPMLWQRARDNARFRRHFTLAGTRLANPPRGFAADAPHVEDLKRRDFIASCDLPDRAVLSTKLADDVTERLVVTRKLMAFLCGALDLPW